MIRIPFFFCLAVFCLSLILAAPFSALAQNAESDLTTLPLPETLTLDSEGKTQEENAILPADIPEILMQEVNRIESDCRRNYMYSSFHDCRCIAIKFLDARLKSDPQKTSFHEIRHQTAAMCVNEATIAGYIYPSCHDVMQVVRPDTYQQFCRCAANNVARSYAARPIVNLSYIDRLRSQAFRDCGLY